MKLLLDENLPKRLKSDFHQHEIYTVREKGWNGVKNGELLNLMLENGFDALLTFDKNLQHQQNFEKYSITVIVISSDSNMYKDLTTLTPDVLKILASSELKPGPIVVTANAGA